MLYISIGYLVFTGLVLLRNLIDFKALNNTNVPNRTEDVKISICIPARNEVDVIERCVTSALKQNYTNFEVIVLDDQSTDGTSEILEQLSGIINNLIHLKGKAKPDDWHGKPWACHQLSEAAKGDVLIFIDADVWLDEEVVPKALTELSSFDAITIWPEQIVDTFWEKQVIPLIYFALYTLLPAKYVEQAPQWLPNSLKAKFAPLFAAACGQFIAFNRKAYDTIGGHRSVKKEIIEDVQLAKNIKSSGLSLKMLHGVNSVFCRMYTTTSDMWNGFRKNFFVGFNSNIFFFLIMAVLHVIVFILPLIGFIYGFQIDDNEVFLLSSISCILIFLQRAILNFIFKWDIYSAFTHFIGVLWFQFLGIRCLIDYFTNRSISWKGRNLD
jgi:chlorobactene glucosyltransferase